MKENPEYTFCATATAGPMTPWHIRPVGREHTSLCGRTVKADLPTKISIHNLCHCCQKCAARYEEVSKQMRLIPCQS